MTSSARVILENGTMLGSLNSSHEMMHQVVVTDNVKGFKIPEIVIASASCSNLSLNRSHCDIVMKKTPLQSEATEFDDDEHEVVEERKALLNGEAGKAGQKEISIANAIHDNEAISLNDDDLIESESQQHLYQQHQQQHSQQERQQQEEEFEQFILNRSTSECNMLDSSIYSELQFPPSINGQVINGSETNGLVSNINGQQHFCQHHQQQQQQQQQLATPQTPPNATIHSASDGLNSSICSRESRQNKRQRRKHKTKNKCNASASAATAAAVAAQHPVAPPGSLVVGGNSGVSVGGFPPQYTTIFFEPHLQHQHQFAAAATTPFLGAATMNEANGFLQQQFQYYQQRPMLTTLNAMGHYSHHRGLFDPVTASADGAASLLQTNSINIGSGATAANGTAANAAGAPTALRFSAAPLRYCFRKWFSRPSLPFIIGILALGGVACTLGGIVLGSTGLIEHSTQYLSAALLMIGIGVSLLVISGAIWRLSLPDDGDECPCYRHMETCRNCNSPFCNNRFMPGSYLYPEFQHRPPPPSYVTSLNECAAMGLFFHPAQQAVYSSLQRINTPPPVYRSTNSLSATPLSTTAIINTNPLLSTPSNQPNIQVPNAEDINKNSHSSDQNDSPLTTSVQNNCEELECVILN